MAPQPCRLSSPTDSSECVRTGCVGPCRTSRARGWGRRVRRSLLPDAESFGDSSGQATASSASEEFAYPPVKSVRVRDVSSVTALKGKSVSLVCPLYVAAWASVSWEKGSSKIPFNHRQRVQPDGSLSISNVQQVSDDGSYVCRFTDSRNQKHTGNVLLKVIVNGDGSRQVGGWMSTKCVLTPCSCSPSAEPPVISHYEFRQDMQVGMRIKVFCTVVRGDAPFLFTWLKDGVPVDPAAGVQAGLSVQNQRDYSMLSADSLQLEHSGNYTCVVKNQAATTTYSAMLRVNGTFMLYGASNASPAAAFTVSKKVASRRPSDDVIEVSCCRRPWYHSNGGVCGRHLLRCRSLCSLTSHGSSSSQELGRGDNSDTRVRSYFFFFFRGF
ncbi:putative cell adhesion molecule [Ixodes scapularis]